MGGAAAVGTGNTLAVTGLFIAMLAKSVAAEAVGTPASIMPGTLSRMTVPAGATETGAADAVGGAGVIMGVTLGIIDCEAG